jgi:hypothetical protein
MAGTTCCRLFGAATECADADGDEEWYFFGLDGADLAGFGCPFAGGAMIAVRLGSSPSVTEQRAVERSDVKILFS